MRIVKHISTYIACLIIGTASFYGYMFMLFGHELTAPESVFMKIMKLIYDIGLMYIAPAAGGIMTLVYGTLDIFYLTKRVRNSNRPFLIRFLAIFIIAFSFVLLHYLLEVVFDVI
ncbi:hypothetical protein [Reichenbachiella versicolor]|uniref:hypothetical protein n=1 Tax=Reichenbachiella versicolor TaxID=1821036 RepID=UPI000D6E5548|nr:hypothetical protein [Reichenbachiella versicolor]